MHDPPDSCGAGKKNARFLAELGGRQRARAGRRAGRRAPSLPAWSATAEHSSHVEPGQRAPAPELLAPVQAFVTTNDIGRSPCARRFARSPPATTTCQPTRRQRWRSSTRRAGAPGSRPSSVPTRACAARREAEASTGRSGTSLPPSMPRSEGSWPRLKACGRDSCRWVFYDRSKNRSGCWCDPADCGTRERSRRAYQRRRGTA